MKKGRIIIAAVLVAAAGAAFAQARENFAQQQAYAEMQRVSGQVDMLQSNVNELARHVAAIERRSDNEALQAEIAALKSAVAELRRQLQQQRGEIVRDLSSRISKIQQPAPPPPAPRVERRVIAGAHIEYVVQPGDTLSLIAKAFRVSVREIKEMNNLKRDSVRVGQRLNIPKR